MMRTSIKVKTDDFNFKFRVSGVVIVDGKVLLVDMDDSGFLCLPGGYVELGETTETAVIREMNEEVSREFDISDYLGVVENYFINKRNKKMHEISFYYLLNMRGNVETKDFTIMENDKGRNVKLDFKWIPLNEINNYDIRPAFLKEILNLNDLKFNHLVFNELK